MEKSGAPKKLISMDICSGGHNRLRNLDLDVKKIYSFLRFCNTSFQDFRWGNSVGKIAKKQKSKQNKKQKSISILI